MHRYATQHTNKTPTHHSYTLFDEYRHTERKKMVYSELRSISNNNK